MLEARQIEKYYGKLHVLKGDGYEHQPGRSSHRWVFQGGKKHPAAYPGHTRQADSGQVELNGQRTDKLSGKTLAKFRNRHIGFIFQFHHLLPEFDALENVCIPGWIAGQINGKPKKGEELLALLGLEKRMHHKPGELSGGSNNGLPWPGRWSISRISSWPMSQQETWILPTHAICTTCSSG